MLSKSVCTHLLAMFAGGACAVAGQILSEAPHRAAVGVPAAVADPSPAAPLPPGLAVELVGKMRPGDVGMVGPDAVCVRSIGTYLYADARLYFDRFKAFAHQGGSDPYSGVLIVKRDEAGYTLIAPPGLRLAEAPTIVLRNTVPVRRFVVEKRKE